jgi:hypothetical protein
MRFVLQAWRNTKAMPTILRVLCQGGMVVPPLLLVFLLFPLSGWEVNGREVSYVELWHSGAALVIASSMLLVATGAWGSAARLGWARWLLVAAPIVPLILATVHPRAWFTEQAVSGSSAWLSAVFASALIFIGLFLVPSVRAYYRTRNGSAGA